MKATIDVAPYPSPPVELVSAYWARRSGKQIIPHPALYPPIHHPSDPPHLNSLTVSGPDWTRGKKRIAS